MEAAHRYDDGLTADHIGFDLSKFYLTMMEGFIDSSAAMNPLRSAGEIIRGSELFMTFLSVKDTAIL